MVSFFKYLSDKQTSMAARNQISAAYNVKSEWATVMKFGRYAEGV